MPRKQNKPVTIPTTIPGTIIVEQFLGGSKKVQGNVDIETRDIIPLFKSNSNPDFIIKASRRLSLAIIRLQTQHKINIARKGAYCTVPRDVAMVIIERHVAYLKENRDRQRDSLVSAIQEAQMKLATHDNENAAYINKLDSAVRRAKKSLPKTIKAFKE